MDAWCSRVPHNQSLLRYCTRGLTNMTVWTATLCKRAISQDQPSLTRQNQQPQDRTLYGSTAAHRGDQHSFSGFQGPGRQASALHEQWSQPSAPETQRWVRLSRARSTSTHRPGPFKGSPVHLSSIPSKRNLSPIYTQSD